MKRPIFLILFWLTFFTSCGLRSATTLHAQSLLMQVDATANPAVLSSGDKVEYSYTLSSTALTLLPLNNVALVSDQCEPLSGPTGDGGTIGQLEWGEVWHYDCTTTVPIDTLQIITATASTVFGERITSTTTTFVNVLPSAILTKTAAPTTLPEPGGLFSFALTITNPTLEPITITELSDTFPLSEECRALIGTTLSPQGTSICSSGVIFTQPGIYTNTATVRVQDDELSQTQQAATAMVMVADLPSALTVDQRVNPDQLPAPGGLVDVTLTITNSSSADNVVLTNITAESGGSEQNFAANLFCQQTVLAPAGVTTCAFVRTIGGEIGELITNQVTVSGLDDDGASVSEQTSATIEIFDDQQGLMVSKTPATDLVLAPGALVTFSVRITNQHPVDVMTLTGLVDDQYGDVTDAESAQIVATTCALVPISPNAGSYGCAFVAWVGGSIGEQHRNSLTVRAVDGSGRPRTASASAEIILLGASLTVSKRDQLVFDVNGDEAVGPGDRLRYTIRITNTGNLSDTVTVLDRIDNLTSLFVDSVDASQGTVIATAQGVTATLGLLGAGANAMIEYEVTIAESLPVTVTALSNQAWVLGTSQLPVPSDDPDTPLADDATITPLVAQPQLNLTKVDSLLIDADLNGIPSPGDTLAYTLTLSNLGQQNARNLFLQDELDPNLGLVADSLRYSSGVQPAAHTEQGLLFEIAELPTNKPITLTFAAQISAPLPDGITRVRNQAVVYGENVIATWSDDPTTVALNDSTETLLVAEPDVRVSKRDFFFNDLNGDDQVGVGDSLLYVIRITNDGNAAAHDVLLSDLPDPQTSLQSGNILADRGRIVVGNTPGDQSVTVDLGTVAPNSGVNIGFRVVVDQILAANLSNQATVTYRNSNAEEPVERIVFSDDPDTSAVGDPTRTPLLNNPALSPNLLYLPLITQS